jgi:signal transduction histidine kinase
VKLSHKNLLAIAMPYLLLIAAVLVAHIAVEHTLHVQFRRDMKRELTQHQQQLKHGIGLAQAQLRGIAQSPAFRGGNLDALLTAFRQVQPAAPIENVYFRDLEGSVYAPSGKLPAGSAPAIPPDALRGEEFITDFQVGRRSTGAYFFISCPVQSEGGDRRGVLLGEVNVRVVLPPLLLNGDDFGGVLSLQDSQNKNRVLQTSVQRLNRRDWTTETQDVPPMNWNLSLSRDAGPILRPARVFTISILSALTLALLFTAAYVLWSHRAQSVRMAALTEIVQRFGAAEPALRSLDTPSDEIGRLAEAFNNMADDVVHAQRRLRKQLLEDAPVAAKASGEVQQLQAKISELERFNAAVAHDLKAPLVTLQGFAAGLEPAAKSGDWDRMRGDVARIQSAAKDLCGLIDELLEFARLDQHAQSQEAVPLARAAQDALALLQGQIRQSRIAVNLASDLPTASGRPQRWRQVYQNLIDHAIKACHGAPSPTIDIGYERRGEELRCFVRDNGAGLPAEDRTKLFEAPQNGRVGLGLALVKRIIEAQGGRIWAESNGAGQGTIIWWTVSP